VIDFGNNKTTEKSGIDAKGYRNVTIYV